MALRNLLTDDEKAYFIASHKKALTSRLVYDLMAEKKFPVEIAREVVKELRDEVK